MPEFYSHNRKIGISGHGGQVARLLKNSPSDSNIQPRVTTTALILRGPSVLEELLSALPEAGLDMQIRTLTPGPQNQINLTRFSEGLPEH